MTWCCGICAFVTSFHVLRLFECARTRVLLCCCRCPGCHSWTSSFMEFGDRNILHRRNRNILGVYVRENPENQPCWDKISLNPPIIQTRLLPHIWVWSSCSCVSCQSLAFLGTPAGEDMLADCCCWGWGQPIAARATRAQTQVESGWTDVEKWIPDNSTMITVILKESSDNPLTLNDSFYYYYYYYCNWW